MARIAKKRAKVKRKKRKTAKKPPQSPSRKKKRSSKAKAVKKVAKAKTKKRRKKRARKKGVMRRAVEKLLDDPRAQVQITQRLVEKLPHIFLPNWVETDESLMMQRLIRAEQLGAFDNEAKRLAYDFDWDLRSVYELWHSPDVYF